MPHSNKDQCYRFSFGNSTNGPIGAVIVVRARSKKAALERAREVLEPEQEIADHRFEADMDERNEYCNIYFNSEALTLEHLEEVYDIEDIEP